MDSDFDVSAALNLRGPVNAGDIRFAPVPLFAAFPVYTPTLFSNKKPVTGHIVFALSFRSRAVVSRAAHRRGVDAYAVRTGGFGGAVRCAGGDGLVRRLRGCPLRTPSRAVPLRRLRG